MYPSLDVRTECVFFDIIAEDESAYRVYEDDKTLVFLDIDPATRGHVLVVPKAHTESLTDLESTLVGQVFQPLQRVMAAIESAMEPARVNILQSNGKMAGQEISHAHVHVIPPIP